MNLKITLEKWTLTFFGYCIPSLGKPYGKPNYYKKFMLCIYNEKQSCQEIRTLTTSGQLFLFLE